MKPFPKIDSIDKLEEAAIRFGLLPFFPCNITGLSVQELAAPGYLFSEDNEDCWNWKGPVIGRCTTAYGKFFNKKAGFVRRDLFPHFLNFRRHRYPIKSGSTEEMVLEIIKSNEGLTSTQLKKIVFGNASRSKKKTGLTIVGEPDETKPKRSCLESVLQKLQMGGWLLIADFQYKLTRQGERYGWGVALYSTPEIWFDEPEIAAKCTPEESQQILVEHLKKLSPYISSDKINKLIQ